MAEQILIQKQKKKKKEKLSLNKLKNDAYVGLLKKTLMFSLGNKFLLDAIKKKLYTEVVTKNTTHPKAVNEKKYQYLIAMLECASRNLNKGYISKEVLGRSFGTLIEQNMINSKQVQEIKNNFNKIYGTYPPSLIVFSPTQRCNLKCIDCYACSEANSPTLSYEIVDKVVNEVYNEWGNRFMTISGGEPFMYNSNGKTLFDVWEKYKEMYFLVYTNGTMINKEVAEKLAKLGNVTPAISLEGWEKETDERRGKGIFKKVLEAADNLKKAGVPFGVSITATRKNYEILAGDKFYDFVFNELGATYMWLFQLMPVGRASDMIKNMITPEQRVVLYRRWEDLLKEKKYCIGDFWNSGALSDGCIAYGRPGGYLYIDWNGNILPCNFVPFYEDNIIDLYSRGKKLADALFSELFVNGRKWQKEYGLSHTNNPDNWLMPCSIRDNFQNFKKNIISKKAKPEDPHSALLLTSKEHEKLLTEFDEELAQRTAPIWKKEYLGEEEE